MIILLPVDKSTDYSSLTLKGEGWVRCVAKGLG